MCAGADKWLRGRTICDGAAGPLAADNSCKTVSTWSQARGQVSYRVLVLLRLTKRDNLADVAITPMWISMPPGEGRQNNTQSFVKTHPKLGKPFFGYSNSRLDALQLWRHQYAGSDGFRSAEGAMGGGGGSRWRSAQLERVS